jgi:glyoxalase family protein
MQLEGIHHVTAITADAPGNVEFYAGVLGLRIVKKTVNQDDPTVYHLFYADEKGSAGSDITFFEYPGVPNGRAGDGMVHRVDFRVASDEALDFWQKRLENEGVKNLKRSDTTLLFDDPEGLTLGLVKDTTTDEPLRAETPGISAEVAIRGFDGVHAYAGDPEASRGFLEEALNFRADGSNRWEARGEHRGGFYRYDAPPGHQPMRGAGTVHHVAWGSPMDEHTTWRERVKEAGFSPTPVIDRFYFRSIYFQEPSGVLFEIATLGPGFTADEDLATLGQGLSLPPDYEHLRDKLKDVLTPLPDPRRRAEAESDA